MLTCHPVWAPSGVYVEDLSGYLLTLNPDSFALPSLPNRQHYLGPHARNRVIGGLLLHVTRRSQASTCTVGTF